MSDNKNIDLQIIAPEAGSPSTIRIGHNKFINGVEKLSQKILMILLTKKGSMVLQPEYGTTFLIEKEKNIWKNQTDILSAFAVAKIDLLEQLEKAEPEFYSKIKDIIISKIKIFYDRVEIQISVEMTNNTNIINTVSI